eukprot:171994-Prymnesium_polylepis.1
MQNFVQRRRARWSDRESHKVTCERYVRTAGRYGDHARPPGHPLNRRARTQGVQGACAHRMRWP